MENVVDSIKENYNLNLKARKYNEELNGAIKLMRREFGFILQFLHDVIQSERFNGTKALDMGSGATVHNIASASSKFSSIVQSDYVLDNCEELKGWHRGESCLDWSQFLDLVLQIEGKEGDLSKSREELEARIRSSVKCVVRGDLLSNDVLPVEELTPESSPPYDLIISSLCIEAVALDFDGYVAILKRINKLLRPGGGLIVCGFENGSKWQAGENIFHHVKLTLNQVLDAFDKAGFGKCDVKALSKREIEYDYDYDSLFCIAAEKV